jgi:hypothetical protein
MLLGTREFVFEATLPSSQTGVLSSIPMNSDLRIVGICLVRSGGLWSVPQSFRILVRSANDVVVLRIPSWWNFRTTTGTVRIIRRWY